MFFKIGENSLSFLEKKIGDFQTDEVLKDFSVKK
jgi:hypothetical protein